VGAASTVEPAAFDAAAPLLSGTDVPAAGRLVRVGRDRAAHRPLGVRFPAREDASSHPRARAVRVGQFQSPNTSSPSSLKPPSSLHSHRPRRPRLTSGAFVV